MKKIIVTGANGQLGRSLQAIHAAHPSLEIRFTGQEELDASRPEETARFLDRHPADWVINCAAYTNVDKAESDRDACATGNTVLPENLALLTKERGAKLLHVSTDYVFDGRNCLPYREEDPTNPQSVYGQTKLAGEQRAMAENENCVVIRTSWLYSEYGKNFLKTMLRLGAEKPELGVVFDQIGTPTYAGDLAEALLRVVESDEAGQLRTGCFHYSNEGVCSWYDFACEIMRQAGLKAKVRPIETGEYPYQAERPPYSVLNKKKIKQAYGLEIPHWTESLRRCLENMNALQHND